MKSSNRKDVISGALTSTVIGRTTFSHLVLELKRNAREKTDLVALMRGWNRLPRHAVSRVTANKKLTVTVRPLFAVVLWRRKGVAFWTLTNQIKRLHGKGRRRIHGSIKCYVA